MTIVEKYTLALQVISTLGLGLTIVYAALQLKASRKTNAEAHDWNRRKAAQDMCCQYEEFNPDKTELLKSCLLYTSPSPRDQRGSRMPSSA